MSEMTRLCEVCGALVLHREIVDALHSGRAWWSAVAHKAPCGNSCMGGGLVRPTPAEFDGAHRRYYCGAKGCEGGASRGC